MLNENALASNDDHAKRLPELRMLHIQNRISENNEFSSDLSVTRFFLVLQKLVARVISLVDFLAKIRANSTSTCAKIWTDA